MPQRPEQLGKWQRIDQGGSLLGTGVGPSDFKTAARKYGRHFARYRHAAAFVAGRRVIDAACGMGYGSAYVAQWADYVLGVELDEAMLARASEMFSAPNLEFRKHDLHDPLQAEQPFDVVLSFETLEHVREPAECLARLGQCLAGDGIALISVPNGPLELAHQKDKHHMSYFSAEQFQRLLHGGFQDVLLFSQIYHRGPGHYLRKWAGRGRHHADNYRFLPGASPGAKTWLAHCRRPKRG